MSDYDTSTRGEYRTSTVLLYDRPQPGSKLQCFVYDPVCIRLYFVDTAMRPAARQYEYSYEYE